MVKTFLVTLTIVFAVIGICELIYIVKMFFWHPGVQTKNFSLLVLKKGFAVAQLKYIYKKRLWYGDDFSYGIVGLIDMLDQYEIEQCIHFAKDKKIILCALNDFSDSEYIMRGLFDE